MIDDELILDSSIDQVMSKLPVGSIKRAVANTLYGINFTQTGNAVPKDRSTYGYTFFTRPQLNLSLANVSNYRGFYNLLTDNSLSYQRFTRMILDPRMGYNDTLKSPFVDNENPFISVLTNNIVSLSGWPDLVVPTYTSDTGIYGEEISFADGVTNHFESYDLDVTFRNIKGNPLLYLFYIWIKYQTLVVEGILNPYIDMIAEREIDYNTRIYRLVMDQQKRYVMYIGATGASFPLNVPTGNLFDFNTDTPYNTRNSEINIRFRCMGFIGFEDILKLKFNQTVAIFNPEIRKLLLSDLNNTNDEAVAREDSHVVHRVPVCKYIKIPHSLGMLTEGIMTGDTFYSINHRPLPYINLVTSELEWWIDERWFNTSNVD